MIYDIYRYYKILRLCIAVVSLLYYFTIYYPLSITRTNQYKYHYYVQELLYYHYVLKLLYYYYQKNYCYYSTITIITKTIIQELLYYYYLLHAVICQNYA